MKVAVAANVAGMVAAIGTMLISVPVSLALLGPAAYGILAIVLAVLGYFSALDFGVGLALVRLLARELPETPAAGRLFWTAALVGTTLGFGLALVAIGFVVGLGAERLGSFGPDLVRAAPLLLLILPALLLGSVLAGALEARSAFVAVNAAQAAGTILIQFLPIVAMLLFGPKLTNALAGLAAGRILALAPLAWLCLVKLRPGRPQIERRRIDGLATIGGWAMVSRVTSSALETGDRLVIGAVLGPAASGWYAIAYQVANASRIVPHAIWRALFPRIAADDARSDVSEAVRLVAMVAFPMMLGVLTLGHVALGLWMGPQSARHVVPVLRVFALGLYFNALAYVALAGLQATGRTFLAARWHLLELPVFGISTWLATAAGGLTGAAWIWSLRLIVDATLLFRQAALLELLARNCALPGTLLIANLMALNAGVESPVEATTLFVATIAAWVALDAAQFRQNDVPSTLAALRALAQGLGRSRSL
jgi:O-antigen/teichoic acid export membrane protein